jgi:hypothetical protein
MPMRGWAVSLIEHATDLNIVMAGVAWLREDAKLPE